MARDAVKISRNLDDNAVANVVYTQLSDGADVLAINADGSLNATITNASLVVTATDLDIRDLSHTQDSVKIGDGIDLLAVNTDGSINITDNNGSITVDGTVAATQSGTWDIGTLTSITNPVSVVDGGGSITVDAIDLDIRDLSHTQDSVRIGDGVDLLAVNTDGSINVAVVSASAGTPVLVTLASSLAASASDNHDYTATGGAFEPSKVQVTSESIATFEILTGPTATLVSRGKVRTSVEHPNAEFKFPTGFSIASTEIVRVIRTNDSNKTKEVGSTISGTQL